MKNSLKNLRLSQGFHIRIIITCGHCARVGDSAVRSKALWEVNLFWIGKYPVLFLI